MSKPLILVIGATGTVGSELVEQLAETGQRVRALVRDPRKAERFPKAVEVVQGDLEKPEALVPAIAGVDKAFVVLPAGPMLPTLEGNAFEVARKGGIGHIVKLSARHVDADFMASTALAQWHREGEQRLRSLRIPWTILRPGTFASNVLSWLDRKNSAIFLPVGDGRDSFVDPRDIAAVAVALLTRPGPARTGESTKSAVRNGCPLPRWRRKYPSLRGSKRATTTSRRKPRNRGCWPWACPCLTSSPC